MKCSTHTRPITVVSGRALRSSRTDIPHPHSSPAEPALWARAASPLLTAMAPVRLDSLVSLRDLRSCHVGTLKRSIGMRLACRTGDRLPVHGMSSCSSRNIAPAIVVLAPRAQRSRTATHLTQILCSWCAHTHRARQQVRRLVTSSHRSCTEPCVSEEESKVRVLARFSD